MSSNMIKEMTFSFAIKIVNYTEKLEAERRYVIARQLLKSGTSIGANVREAQNSESKADFIHKMKIAAKEAEEAEYWLLICHSMEHYPPCGQLLEDLIGIKKVLSKIIGTLKNQG